MESSLSLYYVYLLGNAKLDISSDFPGALHPCVNDNLFSQLKYCKLDIRL